MPRIYFAPIHVHNPDAQADVDAQLALLQDWGVHIANTEIRDPAMLQYVDGMVANFSYGDNKLEAEVLKARQVGKPVLAMVSAASQLQIPESVREVSEQGGMFIPAHSYTADYIAASAIKTFLGAHLGYHGPTTMPHVKGL